MTRSGRPAAFARAAAAALSLLLAARPGAAAERVAVLDLDRRAASDAPADLKRVGADTWEWYVAEGRQTLALDLDALGVDPKLFDEIRFEVNPLVSQVGMWMMLRGHPGPGQVSRWYLKFRTPTATWSEGRYELGLDDDGAYCREGDPGDPSRSLTVCMYRRPVGYPGEPEWRRARVRGLRLVRHVVSAEFRLLETEFREDGGEIAYVYRLHLENRTDAPQRAAIELDSAGTLHHFAVDGPDSVALQAGERKAVPVRISMPARRALALPPLYAEPLFVRVSVPGVPDSDVVPLRGYRRFPMWAAVPVFNRAPWEPAAFGAYMAARAKNLPGIEDLKRRTVAAADAALEHRWPVPDFGPPGHDQGYRCEKCRCWLKPFTPTSLHRHACPKCGRIEEDNPEYDRAWLMRYNSANGGRVGDLALAWLFTGDERYALKAREILLDYAAGYEAMPVTGTRSTAAGSRLGASTLHSSYVTQRFAEGYCLLEGAECLDERSRAAIVAFLKRAGVELVQHSVEYSNQQAEHFYAYGAVGFATRFWPLVAEAIHGEFGFHEVAEYGYTEDGIAHEGGAYHHAVFDAMNRLAILACGMGVNLYTPRFKRVFDGSQASGLARTTYELAYRAYRDASYLPLVATERRGSDLASALFGVEGVPDARSFPARSVHMPGAGHIYLRKGSAAENTEIRLTYIAQFDRHERDRLTAFLYRNGRQVDGTVGRITYGSPHSSWMESTAAHNCVVVDGEDAEARPSRLVAYDPSPDAPAAAVVTDDATPLYEGVRQVRAVALVDDCYVVFDRVTCDRPRTLDRYQWGRGRARLRPAGRALADAPPKLPRRGSFSGVEGGPCGRELVVEFENGLAMRLVSDGDMSAYKAISVGGYQADPMEVTFARREAAREAAFLAGFACGEKAAPPELSIAAGGDERMSFRVRTSAASYTVTVDVAAGSVKVER